jgi:hypothetical protein
VCPPAGWGKRGVDLPKTEKEGWRVERLIALKMGFSPENTLAAISEVIGGDVMTIQRWFKTCRKTGLEAVLKRHYKGRTGPIVDEEVEPFLSEGLEHARWNTAVQAHQDLEKKFKRSCKYKTVGGDFSKARV